MTLMGVKVSVLGSGSRGNTTFIKTDSVRVLIDAGLSRKELAARLQSIGEDPDGIDLVLVTHEHTDHSAGLKGLLKELPVTAYMTAGTIRALRAGEFERNRSVLSPIAAGATFCFGDVEVTPFPVPHDAADPVAFSIRCGGVRVTQLTDIGHMPDCVAEYLRDSDVLILESNHDVEMLRVGPYPFSLKQRLMGRFGHLSNTAVARFIRDQYDGRASHFVLAHLSAKNNHPELARQEAVRALRDRGFSYTPLVVTGQEQASIPICLS